MLNYVFRNIQNKELLKKIISAEISTTDCIEIYSMNLKSSKKGAHILGPETFINVFRISCDFAVRSSECRCLVQSKVEEL